jgi:hydroxymethylglutaryl-CoA reductase
METSFLSFPEINLAILTKDLNTNTKPIWGNMSAWQMIEHLTDAVMVSIGEFESPVFTEDDKVAKIKRMFIDSDSPFRKDFKSPIFRGDGIVFRNATFEDAIDELNSYVAKFVVYYEQNSNRINTHPVFGPLSKSDWERFHSKHFTHHFRQFGLIS